MDIRIQKGDITTAQNGYIFHGVNCQGAMGSGVAYALYNKWPEVKQEYLKLCDGFKGREDELLGAYQVVSPAGTGILVVNGFTQFQFGHGRRFASPMAIEWSLRHFCQKLSFHGHADNKRVHLPKIGGERGGLDFDKEVMPVIERVARWYPDITFVIWEYGDGD